MSVWAVLAAAGRGERLGGDRPKAFAKLRGRPLLAESLERLEASDWVDSIMIAAPVGWEEPSILVAEVGDEAAIILVHDAARPLLPEDVLGNVLTALNAGWDGAVPVLPLADTIKRVDGARVAQTVPREDLVAAQTPQAFLAPVLRDAVAGDLGGATDCSSLVEARGGRIAAVPGDRRLLKVTGPEDLALVEGWL